jgi:hypothetical protein
MMNETGFWRSQKTNTGIFKIIDDGIRKLVEQNPNSFPDLRSTSTILITSDYSGEHSGSRYQVLSFLFTNIERCQQWEEKRTKLRAKMLSNKRRMSFKGLNDKQKQRALAPFLEAANTIPGLVFTVAIDSTIKSLFEGPAPLDLNNPDFAAFRKWKSKTLEKASIAIHFISFLLEQFKFSCTVFRYSMHEYISYRIKTAGCRRS